MSYLTKPASYFPEYIITAEETMEFARKNFILSPFLEKALKLIKSTGVKKRHLIQPIDLASQHPGFGFRNKIFECESKRVVPSVIAEALSNAECEVKDISAIIYVSCSGFMMPSLTAWLINYMGFNLDTVQIPIAQLGCAAGAAAINRASDFIIAHPNSNVLIVSCEFNSLSYQPSDHDIGSLLSDGLFGDAVTAAVLKSESDNGVKITKNKSYLIPNTEEWIRYDVKDTGFHFRLDKRVPGTMEPLAPVMISFGKENSLDISNLDFYIIHAGGPRILDDLCKYLNVPMGNFSHSRKTLENYGNIASSVVLETYRKMFEDNYINVKNSDGVIAGFGPGITAEISLSRNTHV